MRTIPQRELRNNISQVLRDVERGERIRNTVDGRPVADLLPVAGQRRTFVPREDVETLLNSLPVDPAFSSDIDSALSGTLDELTG